MNLEGRKNNIYYDKKGVQILPGDLLKVYHYKSGRNTRYMYHVVGIEETPDFPVMACKEYYADKLQYRLYVAADNEQRVYFGAEIIAMRIETPRKKIKVAKGSKK